MIFKKPPYKDLAKYADNKAVPRWLVYIGAWGILNIGDQSRVMFLSLVVLTFAAIAGSIGLLFGNGVLSAIGFLMLSLSLGVMKITDLLYAAKGASWQGSVEGLDRLTCDNKDREHKMRELMLTMAEINAVNGGCFEFNKGK